VGFVFPTGGTIFLDEIGEVPMEVQVKLLRVLQEREFERVGGSVSIKVDVRVIAATNRDLPKAIREGKFREDLYYRLNVFPIELPPLRERAGDVPLLVQFLVAKFGAQVGRVIESIDQETMQRLTSYSWPGNIRELENILERAIILSDGPTLVIGPEVFMKNASARERDDVTATASQQAGNQASGSLESIERNHILAVLRQVDWVIDGPRGAAKILDLHPNTLRSRMKKLGIKRTDRDIS
jgi:transcriptional regulator with GAF, ATPase, and Fis domain